MSFAPRHIHAPPSECVQLNAAHNSHCQQHYVKFSNTRVRRRRAQLYASAQDNLAPLTSTVEAQPPLGGPFLLGQKAEQGLRGNMEDEVGL